MYEYLLTYVRTYVCTYVCTRALHRRQTMKRLVRRARPLCLYAWVRVETEPTRATTFQQTSEERLYLPGEFVSISTRRPSTNSPPSPLREPVSLRRTLLIFVYFPKFRAERTPRSLLSAKTPYLCARLCVRMYFYGNGFPKMELV